jgi:hypothetical protein
LPKNWDELLKGISGESETPVKSTEVVEDARINSESPLPESIKLIDISPTGLEDFG